MFITLLVATATLDGLPPYRTVLNCFHLLWTIVLIYFKLFSYILGWFYRLIIALTFKLFTFKLLTLFSLQYFCASVSLKYFCTSPSPFHGYIYGGKPKTVYRYWSVSKYIVPLAKPIRPPVRDWLPYLNPNPCPSYTLYKLCNCGMNIMP